MKIRQIGQRITDLDRAIAFYNLVLEKEPIAVFNPPGFAFYDLAGVRLFLDVNAPSAAVYLEVDDVRAKLEELRQKGLKIHTEAHVVFPDPDGIFDEPGDEWLGFIEDSEGNLLGFMSRN